MNPLDRNLDGCCVRNLPIGKPFRARFEVPKDYEANFTDTTDVFILLRYKDMQGGEIIDLVNETEKQDIPLETKENTLKRRILNRQNITREKTSDKQDEADSDSEVESVTTEDVQKLHIDSETGNLYYDYNNSMIDRSIEADQEIVEMKEEEDKEQDENCLQGTEKIIQALQFRQANDRNIVKTEPENNHIDLNTDSIIERREESEKEKYIEPIPPKRRGRKRKADLPEVMKTKVKKIEENETGNMRRVSNRLRALGFRPDYGAMEELANVTVGCNDKDDDDTDSYDVHHDDGHGEKSKISQKKKASLQTDFPESKTDDQEEKFDNDMLDAVLNVESQKHKKKWKQKSSENRCKSNDEANNDQGCGNIDNEAEQKLRKNCMDQSNSSLETDEVKDGTDVPDVELNDNNKFIKKTIKDKTDEGINSSEETNEEHSERKLKTTRSKRKKNVVKGNSPDKTKRKQKRVKYSDSKTKTTENDDDSTQVGSDPELKGLAPYRRNLLIARRKKLMEQQIKQATRIKVKLHEHTDKWKRDVMDSYMRKDRGKARSDVAVEMYVCTVCDKYKAESKESMENHIEMHVNGDLHCNHPQCSFIAVTGFELQKHKREVHKKNIWICDICGVETIGREGLKDHLGKVHNNPQWSCKLCLKEDKKFASVTLHEYKKHIRVDHPESLFKCDGCKRLFAQQHKLDNHLKLGCEGEGNKSYSCEKCGKVFSSHDSVKRHIMRVHNKERSFQCPYCPFTAARQTNLTSHLNVHEGHHPYKCDQCTFSCVQKYQLKSHMRTHSGEKPYKCTQCNYAAAWNVQLKDHVKFHSLPSAVSCEHCRITFKDVRSLKTHETKEHGLSSPVGTSTQTEVKATTEPQQLLANAVNSTYAVPQSYAQVVDYSYAPALPMHYVASVANYTAYE